MDIDILGTKYTIEYRSYKKDNKLQELITETKLLKKLPGAIEIIGYSGTVGTLVRIKNAEIVSDGETAYLKKGNKTKRQFTL